MVLVWCHEIRANQRESSSNYTRLCAGIYIVQNISRLQTVNNRWQDMARQNATVFGRYFQAMSHSAELNGLALKIVADELRLIDLGIVADIQTTVRPWCVDWQTWSRKKNANCCRLLSNIYIVWTLSPIGWLNEWTNYTDKSWLLRECVLTWTPCVMTMNENCLKMVLVVRSYSYLACSIKECFSASLWLLDVPLPLLEKKNNLPQVIINHQGTRVSPITFTYHPGCLVELASANIKSSTGQ